MRTTKPDKGDIVEQSVKKDVLKDGQFSLFVKRSRKN
jgi:hypothetical protein